MGGHDGCYLIIKVNDTKYYRYVKKYSDAQESSFKADAKLQAAGGDQSLIPDLTVEGFMRSPKAPAGEAVEI
ncbi:hypothetical protein [Stenotrophomonas sp.]|uniref:hypothetical protein n=1 Tax=Stenotrophomonas sp. TaxID=69392 RepID=UPI00289C0E03|nr:hypothetical protein [Stenotrophomonas sp.]